MSNSGINGNLLLTLILLVIWFPLHDPPPSKCEASDEVVEDYRGMHPGALRNRWFEGRDQGGQQWTPDGSHIVFGHAGRIYLVDSEGANLRTLSSSYQPLNPLSNTTDIDFSPSLSPDGYRVAYTTLRYPVEKGAQRNYEIATQTLKGKDCKRLTNNEWNDFSPSWAPRGPTIAYISEREDGLRVYAMEYDGTKQRSLAPSVETETKPPQWSPTGNRLAFVGKESEDVTLEWVDTYSRANPVDKTSDITIYREALYTVGPDGSGLTKIEWGDPRGTAPAKRYGHSSLWLPEEDVTTYRWSPSGSQIAFVARRHGEADNIYVGRADGSKVSHILDFSSTLQSQDRPSDRILNIGWSPDGSQIQFEAGYTSKATIDGTPGVHASVYVVSAEGSGLRILVNKDEARRSNLPFSQRLEGPGPARIVRYTHSDDPNIGRQYSNTVLATVPWGADELQLLVRIIDNRLVPANPPRQDVSNAADLCANKGIVLTATAHPGLVKDCKILLQIRDTLAGDEELPWTPESTIFEWPGIGIEGEPPRVTSIITPPGIIINGTIPAAIGELEELRILRLEKNALTGSLPPEIGQLNKLEVLNLEGTAGPNLNGRIPAELGNLQNLKVLNLKRNELTGPIPPELGNMTALEVLDLEFLPLTGSIPPEIGKLRNLKILNLFGNPQALTGRLPPELGNLQNLEELRILVNSLEGPIPPELGKLTNLRILDLRGNLGGLTGPIPPELGNLTMLNTLLLSNNRLSGDVPPELGNLVRVYPDGSSNTYLFALNLEGNLLTGCVPPALSGIIYLSIGSLPLCE